MLNNNALTGSIPPELGSLTNLSYLMLNNNALTGSIPAELGDLAALRSLSLGSNEPQRLDSGRTRQPVEPRMGWTSAITA